MFPINVKTAEPICPTFFVGPRVNQGIGIKEKEMALVWDEKAGRTALQTSSVNLTHTLLEQIHNMTTFKEIAEQCCQL